jgi:predicted porin
MKQLLLGTAAVALGLSLASPAQAQVKLGIGGYFKGYVSWLDQDTTADDPATALVDEDEDVRSLDILRDTEVHFSGEYALDNGLTVGFHTELEDDLDDNFGTQESYGYFSGAWGRVNLGAEDGAAYLLQVAAPSADSNLDGLRQWVQPVNYGILSPAGLASASVTDTITIDDILTGFAAGNLAAGSLVHDRDSSNAVSVNDILVGASAAPVFFPGPYGNGAQANAFDYDQAVSGFDNKITYLSPVFSGFQVGVSYTPELTGLSQELEGHNQDDQLDDYGDVFDLAARWEGMFSNVGIALGAGYTHASHEADEAAEVGAGSLFFRDVNGNGVLNAGVDELIGFRSDREAWNVGLDLNWGAFGLGGAYMEDDLGISDNALEQENWVVGIDYTTGPFKLGASYYSQEQSFATAELDTERWSGGVVYTYGPGMTFRGSVSFIDHDENLGIENGDTDATSFLLGTQVDF